MRMRILLVFAAATLIGCNATEAPPGRVGTGSSRRSAGDRGADVRLEDVKKIVARQYEVAVDQLDVNRPLLEYGDELNVIEVVMDLEERYRVEIPDECFMDKAARGSLGIHKGLTTARLADIVRERLSH
ncbi:MAG TPA: phosphopantetheine-binding protein [Gemmataceae bacterium]|nr:phosphopantetheine-binding protein [Gemmataceae bacterium]